MPKNQEFSNLSNLKIFCTYLLIKWILSIDKVNIQHLNLNAFFPRMVVLKKYPKISGYLDRISKIWIMKKFDIQSIQVSMYPKKMDIHVSKYPCIQVCMISKYPIIQGQLQIWTEHSHTDLWNLKPVEISKNHFNIIWTSLKVV